MFQLGFIALVWPYEPYALSWRHTSVIWIYESTPLFTNQQWIRNYESTLSHWDIPLIMTGNKTTRTQANYDLSKIYKFILLSIIIKILIPTRIQTQIFRFAVRRFTTAPLEILYFKLCDLDLIFKGHKSSKALR